VAAQSAVIGIATADLYPSIAITGQISLNAEEFSDLFKSLSQGGSIGPSFQWNVLNFGRIRNNILAQEESFYELVANYQNTVLTANQDVEDALVSFLRTQGIVKSLADSASATDRALKLELIRFKEGESDFTGVFVLQGDLATKQDQLAAARGEVVTSLISVYKALGGGWEIRCSSPGSLDVADSAAPRPQASFNIAPLKVEKQNGDKLPEQNTMAGIIRQAFSRNKPQHIAR
jgi:outer membrane protein TolC